MSTIADALESAGMAPAAAAAKEIVFSRLGQALASAGPSINPGEIGWFVPGRIEVLGKHTDYMGGRSLLCAADRGFCALAVPLDDERVVVLDVGRGARLESTAQSEPSTNGGAGAIYARSAIRRLTRNFPGARRGAAIALESDLPAAAGMSSSSALLTAIFLILADVNDLPGDPAWTSALRTREDLAGYLAAVENGSAFGPFAGDCGVGTAGGSEDHTAILCCEAGRLAQYAFCPVRRERVVPFGDDLVFAVGSSGVHAQKTGDARERYNRAAREAGRILELWRAGTGRRDASLGATLAGEANALDRLRAILRGPTGDAGMPHGERHRLLNRLEQFQEESEVLVPAGSEALAIRDFGTFGAVVSRSQRLAEQWLGNQVPETIALTRLATDTGALAASAFGAGFGGSVWALVPAREGAAFVLRWSAAYNAAFPLAGSRATFVLTQPGPGARRLTDRQL